jgi:predicted ABC-class ATPase
MNLDDELRSALRREDPPLGFTQRVVARAQTKPVPKTGMFRMVWAAGLAAMLVIGFTAASEYRQAKAERAASQAVIALRIAAAKLNMTRDKVLKLEN